MPIAAELERARRLCHADDEDAARDLLLALVPDIERADRDDLMLEVFAQLGEIYLVRGAEDGVAECVRRIDDCLAVYRGILAGTRPDAAAQLALSDTEITNMICRYTRRAESLRAALAAARGDHDAAEAALAVLIGSGVGALFTELSAEHHDLIAYTSIRYATALADDDLYARALPCWQNVITQLGARSVDDHLFVAAATGYGRFCVDTGRLAEAEPWLARACARADARGWTLAAARARLERAAASWARGDHESTERLVTEAYPEIARHARAHDVSRCWLYFGLIRLAVGCLDEADECWQHAERHWRELGAPLQIHRILLQRSWIPVFKGNFAAAVELVETARSVLESAPHRSWLQVARLDSHLGSVWRADALADLGFDASDPAALGVIDEQPGTPRYQGAMDKLEMAADLKIPAALAVDAVRFVINDAGARSLWATRVAAPLLAGAFAVAWEWENIELTSQLIEYHSARGMLSASLLQDDGEWSGTATESPTIDGADGPLELGPLPTLQMDPGAPPILGRYRTLAHQRYGTLVTAALPGWPTWP